MLEVSFRIERCKFGGIGCNTASNVVSVRVLNPDLVKRIGAATALEVRATGIPYVFTPCIAVCRDSLLMLVENKVVACAKHFVEDGGTTKGINENNTVADWHTLLSIHMSGCYHSIIKGVSTIMVSYSSLNAVKMHANHDLVTNFLKGTLKFRGFVVSDWQGIDKITSPPHSNYTHSVLSGVKAGIDMEIRITVTNFGGDSFSRHQRADLNKIMVPLNHTEFIDILTSLVNNNFIPMTRIDDAVRRILRVKFTMGLFENPLADYKLIKHLGRQNGANADDPVLPLPKKASRILVAGSHANNLGYQCGGEPPYVETAGDSMNLTISEAGIDTMSNVCGSTKCVVVLISGRPLVVQPHLSNIDALVAAWLPGTEGQGVADVLFGDYEFTIKLPRTWLKTLDQLPMNVGDKHYDPLYPFGFGLTTTKVQDQIASR
ncbi:hypothetical protein RND71_020730 [Anisodus tanguticus]|uniref:Glycoside hydrolase family 3 C-terminal domain-containing protein n=1 Tax=Anisodus tanguticus TaxID=243964 RepID=A0AAE1RV91_9SOLA|nr:hypothetical protein RND71_020730 [Anisodus tanguticus]